MGAGNSGGLEGWEELRWELNGVWGVLESPLWWCRELGRDLGMEG